MRKNRAIILSLVLVGLLVSIMAAGTINIAAVSITANVEKDSPSTTLSSKTTSVTIQLTDPNGIWSTTSGNIKQWGVQRSVDGGATWQWGPVWQGDVNDTSTWIPFGSLGKNGLPPALFISAGDLVANQGDKLRLAIITDANITLGATITTTP